jgi:universal stress protein A
MNRHVRGRCKRRAPRPAPGERGRSRKRLAPVGAATPGLRAIDRRLPARAAALAPMDARMSCAIVATLRKPCGGAAVATASAAGPALAMRPGMFIRRVLVPVDFSPRSQPSLDYAFWLAELAGAEVDVLHVVPSPGEIRVRVDAYLGRPLPHASPLTVALARESLHELIATCQRRGIVPSLHVEEGDPAAVVVRFAAEAPSDLVVIGTRGHRGLGEMLLGSVAHKIITCARCPVMTFTNEAAHEIARKEAPCESKI